MQGLRQMADGGVRLELAPSPTDLPLTIGVSEPTDLLLAIGVSESTEARIKRLMSENRVLIFSRTSCCMCHVMKRLLSAVGVQPTVIELEEGEIAGAAAVCRSDFSTPALCIGGACVGGLESMVALHLSNNLVPKLVDAGALKKEIVD